MNKKCLSCHYADGLGSNIAFCSYIIKTGESRGCKADENCNRYKPKKMKDGKEK